MSRFSGQSLIEIRELWLNELDEKLEELENCGINVAEAEKSYRIALSKKLLNFTDVRAGSVRSDLARGDKEVAELKLERDTSQVLYDSCQQSIYRIKTEIKIIETDILNERTNR